MPYQLGDWDYPSGDGNSTSSGGGSSSSGSSGGSEEVIIFFLAVLVVLVMGIPLLIAGVVWLLTGGEVFLPDVWGGKEWRPFSTVYMVLALVASFVATFCYEAR